VEYTDGSREYYDLVKDPYELDNLASGLPAARKKELHQALAALTACSGVSCWGAAHVATP